jgi:hypothetical protein
VSSVHDEGKLRFTFDENWKVKMAIFREGTNPTWGAFVLGFVLGALGLDFYWLFTESGPIRWLAQVEGALFGGHWLPKITLLLLFLGEIALLLVLKILIERLTGKRLTSPSPER